MLRAGLECEREPEVIEEVDQYGLARPNAPLALELPIDPGQRDRIVQGVMHSAGVNAEAVRDVLLLGAVL